LASVIAPTVVPFTTTFTPGSSPEVSSETTPVTFLPCPNAIVQEKKRTIRKIVLLIKLKFDY
jgi:hypothetical protein